MKAYENEIEQKQHLGCVELDVRAFPVLSFIRFLEPLRVMTLKTKCYL